MFESLEGYQHALGYLSTPFRSQDPVIKNVRRVQINMITAQLFKNGFNIYSPITYTDGLVGTGMIHQCFSTFKEFDGYMVRKCDYLICLQLEGWEESEGLTYEREVALVEGRPVVMLDPYPILNGIKDTCDV